MTGHQVQIGDIFLIPLDRKSWGVAQVVDAWNEELYVAVFDETTNEDSGKFEELLLESAVFLVLTLDAKLWNGDWPIVGRRKDNLHHFPQPAFKVRQGGAVYIESRDRSVNRPALAQEVESLRYRTVSSPAVIEAVVQAYFGFGDWQIEYEKYRASYAQISSKFLQ